MQLVSELKKKKLSLEKKKKNSQHVSLKNTYFIPGIRQKSIPPRRMFLSQTCNQQFNPIANFPNKFIKTLSWAHKLIAVNNYSNR